MNINLGLFLPKKNAKQRTDKTIKNDDDANVLKAIKVKAEKNFFSCYFDAEEKLISNRDEPSK